MHPVGSESTFSASSWRDAGRRGRRMAEGQVNVVDQAEPHGTTCSASEALVLGHATGCCGMELCHFYWSMTMATLTVSDVSHQVAKYSSQG